MRKKHILWFLLLCFVGVASAQSYRVGDLYTAPDGSRGVVFYVYPNGSGGWVAALYDLPYNSDSFYIPWGTDTDVPDLQNQTYSYFQRAHLMNDTSGYANTLAMRNSLGTSSDYAAGAVDFQNGWYLPSPAQMNKLASQAPFISSSFENAGGDPLWAGDYWTSAEYSATQAWAVNLSYGGFSLLSKTADQAKVRAVRSFTYQPTYAWSTGDNGAMVTVTPEQTTLYAVTAFSPDGCPGEDTITVFVHPLDTTVITIVECESYTWKGVTYDTSGNYPMHYENRYGCDSVVILDLTINNPQHEGITAMGIESYVWFDSVYTTSGDYMHTHLDANGCTQVDTLHLTIYYGEMTQIDTTVCVSDLPLEWGGATFSAAGTRVDSLLTSMGADSLVFWNLHVIELPVITHTPDTAILAGDTATLWAAGSDTFVWTDADGNVAGNENTVSVRPLVSGYYYVTGYSQGGVVGDTTVITCPATDSLWVEILPNPDTMLLTDSSCVFYVWYGDTLTQSGEYYHTMTNWLGYDSVEVLTLTIHATDTTAFTQLAMGIFTWNGETYTEEGDYTVTLQNRFGCDSVVTMHLVFVQLPDNVGFADCVYDPEVSAWSIGVPIISNMTAAMCASVPLVGDIDDDGEQEIVMHTDSKVLIFNSDAVLKSQFDMCNTRMESQMALAKVKYAEGAYKTIMVAYSSNNYFYAYDAAGQQIWQSNQPFSSYNTENYKMPAISFADFNHDGWTEMYAGGEIYDAATGAFIGKTNGNKGHAGRTWDSYGTYQSSAADLLGDATLELAVGNTVYSVDLQSRTDATMNHITPASTIASTDMVMGNGAAIPFTDGNTFLVDINLDEQLDVLVMNVDPNNRVVYLYVWDVASQSMICTKQIPNARKFGMPQIGDIDSDGTPEICFVVGTYSNHQHGDNETIFALKYNEQNAAGEMDVFWSTPHADYSGATSLTLFDFNQDGYSELVYRDENNLRIINGSLVHHLTGNPVAQPYDLATYPCGSGTALEYPIVCDVDLDGAAEIITGITCNSTSHLGQLYIFKSAGIPWAPARKVWNQYMYNVTNVNEDLTIPQYLFNNATVFSDPEGVARRPYNNFLQQATSIDPYGQPFYRVPDVVVNNVDLQRVGNNAEVTVHYCNTGDNALYAPYSLTVFANAYGGDTIRTVTIGEGLEVDSCTQCTIQIPAAMLCQNAQLENLVVAVNCYGNGIAQNGGLQPECDTTNNVASVPFTLIPDTTYLPVTECESYTWIDGSTYTESPAVAPTVVLANADGCDSVVILQLTIHHTTYSTLDTAVVENALPLTLNDSSCTSEGSYTQYLTNAVGCDSILTVNVVVHYNVQSQADSTVCQSELPFIWNDTVFTAAGTKQTIILAHTGADSTVTMHLTVIPTTFGTIDTAVVENDLPLGINDSSYFAEGAYTQYLTSVADCDSILTINLTIHYNVITDVYDTVCESELPIEWNGVAFTAAGTQDILMTATTGADSTVVMHLTVIPTTYGTVNLAVVENSMPTTYNDSLLTEAGTYTQYLTNIAGCDSVLTVILRVLENVSASEDSVVCEGQLPIIWNGVTFTEAGEQPVTLEAVSGADSVLLMILTVIPTTEGVLDTTVVENALPLTINNTVYPTEGTYIQNLTNIANCDSLLTVNLSVHYNVMSEIYDTVCESELPIEWNGVTFAAAGTKDTVLSAYTGADSTVTMHLAVLPTTYGTLDTTVVENALPITINDSAYHVEGSYTQNLTNMAGCDSILSLNLTVHYNVTVEDYYGICEIDLPFTWNDSVFTAAGTQQTTIPASTGADSTVVMHLTVSYPTTGDTSAVACESFTWYDSTYTLSGDYTTTMTNVAGCDSVVTLHLTIHRNTTGDTSAVACESFTWHGETYTQTGDYISTMTNAVGCDSIVTLHLTVNHNTAETINAEIVENNLPYILNDSSYSVTGTYQQHFTNAVGCDSIVTLNLTVYNNVSAQVYTTVCASAMPYTWSGHSFTTAGTVTDTLPTAHGADSVVTYTVTVDEVSANITAVTDVTCYGGSNGAATATVEGGMPNFAYQWKNASGATISTSTSMSSQPAGTYIFTVTDVIGCSASDTVTINALNGELQPGAIAASQVVCDGDLPEPFTGTAASGGDSGVYQWQVSFNGTSWSPAPGTNNTQNYSYPDAPASAVSLRRAWMSQSCGTAYSDTVTITLWPNTMDTVAGAVCQGDAFEEFGFDIGADQTAAAGELVFEQHHATGHCDSVVVLVLTVNPLYETDVEDEVCEGEGYDQNGFHITSFETAGVEVLERTLTLQSAAGCDSVVNLRLNVIDTALRIVSLTPDFCEDFSAELQVITGMPNYVWSTGETSPSILVTHTGSYYVTATLGDCQSTARYVIENCEDQLLLPNAITPSNGDGLNDYFSIPERNLRSINLFEVWIYNRWGELIYYSNDKNFKWNGEYRGTIQYQSVYNYVIKYTDFAGKPYFLKGSVTVL